MPECAHPLDVVGKVLWIAGIAGVILTGIFIIDPVSKEGRYTKGVCNVTSYTFTNRNCTLDSGVKVIYLCALLSGTFVKPTIATTSANLSASVSQSDSWAARRVFNFNRNMKNRTNAKREIGCYVTFGNNTDHQDYLCSSETNMQRIIKESLRRDFPNYYSHLEAFNRSGAVTPTGTYQECYCKGSTSSGSSSSLECILYTYWSPWLSVLFVLCWVGLGSGVVLVRLYGKGTALRIAKFILELVSPLIYLVCILPYIAVSTVVYIFVTVVGGFFCNYEWPMKLEEFFDEGGIFIPVLWCWKNRNNLSNITLPNVNCLNDGCNRLAVLGKLLWIIGIVGIFCTGIFVVKPVSEESSFKQGLCTISRVYYSRSSCQSNGSEQYYIYRTVRFVGYFFETSDISKVDSVKANYISSFERFINHSRYDSYLEFGKGFDYPCSTNTTMLQILNRTLISDFPKYNFSIDLANTGITSNDYYNATSNSSTIYQPCHYKDVKYNYQRAILHFSDIMPQWYTIFFALSWICLSLGLGLVGMYGIGWSQTCAMAVIGVTGYVLGVPYFLISGLCYALVVIIGAFFCNYEIPWEIETFFKKGGVFLPLIFCCKKFYECVKAPKREPEPETPNIEGSDIPQPIAVTPQSVIRHARQREVDLGIPSNIPLSQRRVFEDFPDQVFGFGALPARVFNNSRDTTNVPDSGTDSEDGATIRFNLAAPPAQEVVTPSAADVAPPEVVWEAPPPSYDDVMRQL